MNLLNRKKKKEEKEIQENSEIAKTLGKRGGQKTLLLHGPEHYQSIGRIGGKKKRQDPDYFSKLGKLSAEASKLKRKRLNNDPLTKLNDLLTGTKVNVYNTPQQRVIIVKPAPRNAPKRAKEMRAMATQGYTLGEIGSKYGITRQRVSQILKKNAL